MQRSRVKRRKYASFRTALMLFVILIVLFLLTRGVQQSGLPSGLANLLNAEYENFRSLEQFSEEKVEEVHKEIAGFWTFAEGDPEKSPVAKREYLEINVNGMVWLVKDWFINTPSGERRTVTHVLNGFIKPYSYGPDNESYYCETRVIRQIFIADPDTCYGLSHQSEIWQASGSGGALNMNRRDYQKYEGELAEFFPDGSLLDLVDKITLKSCPAAGDMPFFSKKLFARTIEATPFFMRAQMVDSLIRAFYKPMVLDELVRKYDPRAVPDEMVFRMTLSPEGAVTDLKYKSGKVVTKKFDDMAVVDVKGWLFPPVGDSDEPQKLDLKMRVK